jgi:hypothetical protein
MQSETIPAGSIRLMSVFPSIRTVSQSQTDTLGRTEVSVKKGKKEAAGKC